MLRLFKCVGQAVVAKGLRGLVGALPFGEFLLDVASDAWERWRAGRKDAELRVELQQVAQQVEVGEVRRLAVAVSAEVAPDQPPAVRQALSLYLSLIPSSVRQSLRRPDDPTGTTVPATLSLARSEDLLQMLPARPPRFQPGERPAALGGLELVDLLGAGGFGEVWLARNSSFPDMQAAVKFCLDEAARERFLRHEGQLVQRAMKAQARLALPAHGDGIVSLQDANLTADPPWLRYEYVEGSDLSGLVRNWAALKGPQRARGATVVVRRLAAVVGQFHRLPEPVVHRDLKPANVLVSRSADGKFVLRICDFGISQVAARQAVETMRRSTPKVTVAPTLRGAHTPLYASPQQKLMKDPDVRDDVYALGVIWYQLLLGDLTLERPAGRWRKRVAGLGLDEGLFDLLESCIDDDPGERPRDAAELAERLARPPTAAATVPVTVVPPAAVPAAPPQPSAPRSVQPQLAPPPPVSAVFPPTDPPKVGGLWHRLFGQPGSVLTLSIDAPAATRPIDVKFAWVPPNTFLMGGDKRDNEKPVHRVTLTRGFYLGVFPVTQQQWQAVMGSNPSHFKGNDRPVEEVSWDDCQEFCQKLRQFTSKPVRLPTEAEWEYACRAGTTTAYYTGDGLEALKRAGWCSYDGNWRSAKEMRPVGQFQANAWGLYDMHGNVWEWCQDWYGDYDYLAENQTDPKGATSGSGRVLRGGSWCGDPGDCRAASRDRDVAGGRNYGYGVRVCFLLD